MPAALSAAEARVLMDPASPESIDRQVVRKCLSKSPTSLVRVSLTSLEPAARPGRETLIRSFFEPRGYVVRRIIDADLGIDAIEVDWSEGQ